MSDNKKAADAAASASLQEEMDAVMRKYDRESATRIWAGKPKIVISVVMALFSVYCIWSTLFSTAALEIRLTAFLGLIVIMGYLTYPASKKHVHANRLPWYDIVIMVFGAAAVFYYCFIYSVLIKTRTSAAKMTPFLIAVGVAGILVLAELCRRCVGLPIHVVVGALLVPLGFAAYCYINWRVSGNPFQFLIYQREHWNQRTGLFFSTAAYQTDYFLRSLTSGDWRAALGLWLPNLIACFAALGLLAAAAPKLRASQTAWFLAYYIVAVGATWLLSMTVLRGRPSAFALELPPYRAPQVGQVIVRSVFDRTLFVLGRAAAEAAPAGMILRALANVLVGGASLLAWCAGALDPLGRVMGMDGVLLLAFVLGFPANEIVLPIAVMGYLAQGSLGDSLGLAQMHACSHCHLY